MDQHSPEVEIKDEKQRNYLFPGGDNLTIHDVVKFRLHPSGNHCLEDKDGVKFVVATGWLCIEIRADSWSA